MNTLTSSPVRTRFAPSPTGYLHIGSARTALFAWLFARQHQGQFILRIEDTDRERSTDESIQTIFDGLEWLGIDYDEGPYYQTKRFDRYHQVAQQLLADGHAYRCRCSKARLQQLREQQQAQKIKPRYDGHCRDLEVDDSQPHVIRFRNPQQGMVSFVDMVRGEISVSNQELDDLIIVRTDGSPTYNFTVVVDDYDMKMTHVIRGDDHINNTPRQINILTALGVEPPQYGHVPMILGRDGKKLSKRHGAVSVMQYHEDGYLSQALMNYLVRLGWSYQDQEIFSRQQMIELFDVSKIQRAPAAFDPEKLSWLNQHYMKSLDANDIAAVLSYQLRQQNITVEQGPALTDIIAVQAERCKTMVEMAERSRYFFMPVEDYEPRAAAKFFKAAVTPALTEVRERLVALASWEKATIHQVIVDVAEQFQMKMGQLAQPIRLAISGGTVSPPIDVTLVLIGQQTVIKRLDQAINWIAQHGEIDV